MLDYGAKGELEARLTCAFVAEALHDLESRLIGRQAVWGLDDDAPLAGARDFLATYRHPDFLADLATTPGARHLDPDFELVQDSFRAFADKEIAPVAEHVHRTNGDVPESIVAGLAEMGAFGLSVPAEYGGWSEGGDSEYLGMVVATEELSRGSLGIGGSLITRPEILTRALVRGGTEEQKQEWLPKLALGRGHGRGGRHRARLRLERGRDQGHGDTGGGSGRRAGLRHQRGQDLVHVRRSGRRADAPRPDRCRPHPDASRPLALRRVRSRGARGTASSSRRTAAAGWRGGRSTPSAIGACTPTRSPSTRGGCRPPTWSAARAASAAASTSRWRASRTAACRRRPGRSA